MHPVRHSAFAGDSRAGGAISDFGPVGISGELGPVPRREPIVVTDGIRPGRRVLGLNITHQKQRQNQGNQVNQSCIRDASPAKKVHRFIYT